MKAWLIECQTGCSCCSGDNHYFGPYRTKDEAKAQRTRWLNGEEPNPLASQYARRGIYDLMEVEAEELPDGRVILSGVRVVPDWTPQRLEMGAL